MKQTELKIQNEKKISLLPRNPSLSSILKGYHIIGILAMGRRHFGRPAVISVIRDPLPAAKTTA